MATEESRYEQLRSKVMEFHKQNPIVWRLFAQFAVEQASKGFKHYSAKGVFERIRWETDQADADGRSTFKINNNFSAFYARAFMAKYPEYEGFFRLREQISQGDSASQLPELGPQDYPEVTPCS